MMNRNEIYYYWRENINFFLNVRSCKIWFEIEMSAERMKQYYRTTFDVDLKFKIRNILEKKSTEH